MDLLTRILFMLLAGSAGLLPGGLLARALLGDRPRMGFEGVAEVFFGLIGGALVGLVLGFVISGRLERTGRLWGIVILLVLVLVEVAAVRMLN